MIETHNIRFSIKTEVQDIVEQPGSLTWVNIFKIYKEALTNVIKHSRATEVSVVVRGRSDGVRADASRTTASGVKSRRERRQGAFHMKTRASDIGGAVRSRTTREPASTLSSHYP